MAICTSSPSDPAGDDGALEGVWPAEKLQHPSGVTASCPRSETAPRWESGQGTERRTSRVWATATPGQPMCGRPPSGFRLLRGRDFDTGPIPGQVVESMHGPEPGVIPHGSEPRRGGQS